jgi:hypothetical protein
VGCFLELIKRAPDHGAGIARISLRPTPGTDRTVVLICTGTRLIGTYRDVGRSYRLPPEGADRSGLNDCHSRICSDTSVFSRSSVAFSHRRRSSSSRASTNPARPDLRSGLSRLPYPMLILLLVRVENIASDPADVKACIRPFDCTLLRCLDRLKARLSFSCPQFPVTRLHRS